jgi:ketosteroid isomerase-like protein
MHIGRCLLAAIFALILGRSPILVAGDLADQGAIESAAQDWIQAFNARDLERLLALMTDDVVLADPDLPPASGKEAARKALERTLRAARGPITSTTKEIVVVGDVAWRLGALTQNLPSDIVHRGQVLEIWKRVGDKWCIHRQMASTILAPPKILPRPLPSEPVLDKPRL